MKIAQGWKVAAGAAIAGFTLAAGVLTVAGIQGASSPLTPSEMYDERAYVLLTGPRRPETLHGVADNAGRALRLSPYMNSARLRLAQAEIDRRGEVSPEAVAMLRTSYDLVPFDRSVAQSRIHGSLEIWPYLPGDVRWQVMTEATGFGRLGRKDALRDVQNPQGRLVAAILLQTVSNPQMHNP